MVFSFAVNASTSSVFVMMPIIGFILTSTVCILEKRLQTYMEVFSGFYLTYFILLWVYSFATGAGISPLIQITLEGRPIELMLYTSSGIGMIMGTLAVRVNAYQQLAELFEREG